MKRQVVGSVTDLAISALVGAFMCFFLSRADAFLFGHQLLAVRPIVLFVVGGAPIMALSLFRGRGPTSVRGARPVLLPLGGIVLVALLVGIVNPTSEAADSKLSYSVVFDACIFLFGVMVGGLTMRSGTWRKAMAATLCLTCATILWDAFFPGSFSVLDSRAAGFGENPNVGALAAVLIMVACLNWSPSRLSWEGSGAIVLTAASVFVTQSRGGVLACLLAAGMYLYTRTWTRSSFAVTVTVALAASFVLVAGVAGGPMSEWVGSKTGAGIPVRGEEAYDDSAQERSHAVRDSLEIVSQRPLLGWGNGHTMSMRIGPHNMFLSRWIDNGLFGAVVYGWWLLSIAVFMLRNEDTEGFVLSLIVVLHSFLSHNLLEDRTVLILLGRAAGRIAREHVVVTTGAVPPSLRERQETAIDS